MLDARHVEVFRAFGRYVLAPRDSAASFRLLRAVGRVLVPSYRFQWPDVIWWHYPGFTDYLRRFGEQESLDTSRKWVLSELMRLVESVPGDTAECGTLHGASSYLICRINQRHRGERRTHFVFDSFEGLSDPRPQDGEHWHRGALSVPEDAVRENLKGFEDVRLMKGWIPERFPEVQDRRFAFVHVDVDLHDPTRDSLEFFYPRMQPGGILLCDDYGSGVCPGATAAVDKYLSDKPEKMLEMPGGGGFLIRGVSTLEPAFRG